MLSSGRRIIFTGLKQHRLQITARSISVQNEPIYDFTPGSKERQDVLDALKLVESRVEDIPIVIGGEHVKTNDIHYQVSPYNHKQKIAKFCYASSDLINKAIENCLSVRAEWERKPVEDRVQIFLKAADKIAGEKRAEVLATTMAGQGKSIIQAEIDAGPELVDFFRFNAKYALDMVQEQPISPSPDVYTNTTEYRGLEGFVAAISPFNFTAIGGNLAGSPAMMGNVVLWKPSDTAMLSNWTVYKILEECGLPPGVIQFLPADGPIFGDTITASEHLAGMNFTGSVPTFSRLWKQVGENLHKYRTFPRLGGECGGKNFHFIKSGDLENIVNGTIRSAFEYSGQKCSACSRAYIAESMWPKVKEALVEAQKKLKIGNPSDLSVFSSAVIDGNSFERIRSYLEHAHQSPDIEVLAGGTCDDSKGYFVQPTILLSKNPDEKLMKEEIFGPVLTCYVYKDSDYKDVLKLIDSTSPYALTGSIFCDDETVIDEAKEVLRNATGNLYINDKSTGSVVAQQWFGGARKSGTNDKPGGPYYLVKWVSPVVVKRTFQPLKDWSYPSMVAGR
uniref:delta-1-pyrroline-5-carboxylate dehydrogenase, mitochondrial-like n=1 Tax=Styela clava TaxID=7725 RepID=UPI0019398B01|nr:delta-1-pyrroline-5-carboxylate dehydrogenase, mitochondrial-like [Styela clava]